MLPRMIDDLPEFDRRAMLTAISGAVGLATLPGHVALATPASGGVLDAAAEARKIAFDRIGHGEKVLSISGFPQTRRSWNRLIPLLSHKCETIPADLPSFGDSGILGAPATTENVGKVFHAFVGNLGAPPARRRTRGGLRELAQVQSRAGDCPGVAGNRERRRAALAHNRKPANRTPACTGRACPTRRAAG